MINENDYVIFSRGEYMRIFQVVNDKELQMDKIKCKLNNLVGKPFGFDYELKDGGFHMYSTEAENSRVVDAVSKDNRNLLDRSGNQTLNHQDIEKLKSEDLTAHDIIDKLIENSATFSSKSEFSQEKYIKKKKEKYLLVYKILKPTVRNLCKFYTQAAMKRKLLNMRIDTIAQIMTYGNVAPFRNVLVLESCKGLLLGAVVERLSGTGRIVNLSPNGSHISTMESLGYMNFPAEFTKDLYNFPLEKVDKMQDYLNELTSKVDSNQSNNAQTLEKQTQRLETAKKVNQLFTNKEIDCFLIASKFRPLPILERLIDKMRDSCQFVIYFQIQEPLLECHTFLKSNQKAVHVELTDNWLREYQILPERTHPRNMMDCCSGYLLTGITVQ